MTILLEDIESVGEVTKTAKMRLLSLYAGTICPACASTKNAFFWTCTSCDENIKESPENKALSDACSEHIFSALRVIRLSKERLAKT
ncbi:MAG: hypothetical protein KBC21_02620 [Candidatus Pacebacteria bacterium]|nr:hypothetical protein [Candidatus Paceibacterota bacterium]